MGCNVQLVSKKSSGGEDVWRVEADRGTCTWWVGRDNVRMECRPGYAVYGRCGFASPEGPSKPLACNYFQQGQMVRRRRRRRRRRSSSSRTRREATSDDYNAIYCCKMQLFKIQGDFDKPNEKGNKDLFILGGSTGTSDSQGSNQAFVLQPGNKALVQPTFPDRLTAPVAVFHRRSRRVLACGGMLSDGKPAGPQCYEYNFNKDDGWTKSHLRLKHTTGRLQSVVVNGHWLVAGDGSRLLESYDGAESFVQSAFNHPKAKGFCMVAVNLGFGDGAADDEHGHVLIGGDGIQDVTLLSFKHLYQYPAFDVEKTYLNKMMYPACAQDGGNSVLVCLQSCHRVTLSNTGGGVFSFEVSAAAPFAANTEGIYAFTSVPYLDTTLLVGGVAGGAGSQKIWMTSPNATSGGDPFLLTELALPTGRGVAWAAVAPMDAQLFVNACRSVPTPPRALDFNGAVSVEFRDWGAGAHALRASPLGAIPVLGLGWF